MHRHRLAHSVNFPIISIQFREEKACLMLRSLLNQVRRFLFKKQLTVTSEVLSSLLTIVFLGFFRASLSYHHYTTGMATEIETNKNFIKNSAAFHSITDDLETLQVCLNIQEMLYTTFQC